LLNIDVEETEKETKNTTVCFNPGHELERNTAELVAVAQLFN